jgi:hypothetical protein
MYWEVLSEEDQMKYRQLQCLIDPLLLRTTRQQLPVKFQIIIQQIQEYVVRHDEDDWKRNLVCGIIWLADAVAISTRQLCKLIRKCKTSINFGFQSIGYVTVAMNPKYASVLMHTLPVFARGSSQIRQWTIRGKQMNLLEQANCEKRIGVDFLNGLKFESPGMLNGVELLSGMNERNEFMFCDDGDDSVDFAFRDYDPSI